MLSNVLDNPNEVVFNFRVYLTAITEDSELLLSEKSEMRSASLGEPGAENGKQTGND